MVLWEPTFIGVTIGVWASLTHLNVHLCLYHIVMISRWPWPWYHFPRITVMHITLVFDNFHVSQNIAQLIVQSDPSDKN